MQVNAIYTSDADLWEEWWKYFSRNWLCYVLPFFLGCHFTYLDHVPTLQQIELSGRGLKQMGPLAIVALLLAVLLALASIGFHLWLLFDAGLLLPYGVGVLAFAALFAALGPFQFSLPPLGHPRRPNFTPFPCIVSLFVLP